MRYITRRLGLFLVTLWAALTVNFIIPRVMPGNEASAVLATYRGVNPAALHALEIEFGVNIHQNLIVTYLQYIANCFTGQFGITAQRNPVITEIISKVPWTIGLVGVTTVLAFAFGTLVGMRERLEARRDRRQRPASHVRDRFSVPVLLRPDRSSGSGSTSIGSRSPSGTARPATPSALVALRRRRVDPCPAPARS